MSSLLKNRKLRIVIGVIILIYLLSEIYNRLEPVTYVEEDASLGVIEIEPNAPEPIIQLTSDTATIIENQDTPNFRKNIMRVTLPVKTKLEVLEEHIKLDDECFKQQVDISTNNLRIYHCSFSQKYPAGEWRAFLLDDEQGLIDYFVNNEPGLHTKKTYDEVSKRIKIDTEPQMKTDETPQETNENADN